MHFLSTQAAASEGDSVTHRRKKGTSDPMVAPARKPPRIAGTISSNAGVAAHRLVRARENSAETKGSLRIGEPFQAGGRAI